jgi:serine protease Do
MLILRLTLLAIAALILPNAVAAQALEEALKSARGAAARNAALPTPSAPARELFARYKDRLVQVRVLLNAANEQSALGSAFVVRDDGANGAWLVTNYHVVSSLAIDPAKYRLELRRTTESTVKATLLAVDVIHDLALLRADALPDGKPWPAFELRDAPAAQGERVYALGNPLELGFLISEGIYNGQVEQRIYEQMLFSGALNAGMSGGPAIDERGRVVGVNVATHSGGQLLSFLVPIRYAKDLLERTQNTSPGNDWRNAIGRQLTAHQQTIVDKLFAPKPVAGAATPSLNSAAPTTPARNVSFATQTLSGRTVATLDGSLTKCWASARDTDQPRYHRETLQCSLNVGLYVTGKLRTGSMRLSHRLMRNEKLATPQFLALDHTPPMFAEMGRAGWREMTRAECRDDYVKGQVHVYRTQICLRAFKRFDGLFDMTVSATQMDDVRERLTSSLTLNGFSFDNAQRVSRQFLDKLQ